ncbi:MULTISPECIES: 2-hydroxyacid dehydrogenase [Comamonas]|uniref:D-2-hydroxyacid dehydrogenase n=1 Tax=Comamonas testosteroni TaxID=285 RepID=A0A096FPS5_COMTE|nr:MULTISPECIES: 2-hydroxyacid dehydrogenase [Comamonas]KGH31768.1 D-2-hydroxyacid dehydrogenase [Comamonas testosteroni]MPT08534.1 2-hydroxyacid dehydrogenase [Comamonas sp.]
MSIHESPNPQRPWLLLLTALAPAMRERLQLQFELLEAAGIGSARRSELCAQVRAMLCNAQSIVSREQMQQWPALELIVVIGVGRDGIDLEAAAELGIKVSKAPDVCSEDIADHTLALLLAATRQIVQAHEFVRQGRWLQGRYPPTLRFSGQRMGIVGLGRIGRAVARRSQAFDLTIAYTGRAPKDDVPYRWCDSVRELAAEVDFLVVCASGGPATRGLIDAEVLQALGPQGVLVNVGRGSIVDEVALQQALQERTIAAAALDVFAHEPQVPEALMDLPSTVLTPHMASSTLQGLQAMLAQAEADLLEHFGLPEITD